MLAPLSETLWTPAAAGHLLNRAGFGGTPEDIDRLHKMGLHGAVNHLVDYESFTDSIANPEGAKMDPARADKQMELRQARQKSQTQGAQQTEADREEMQRKAKQLQAEERRDEQRLLLGMRGWWLERMMKSPRPLEEKLTLFWHGHFATSAQKVREAYMMWLQNDTLRKNASGNWPQMLMAMARDPAMLVWLDQAQSKREHPNENFARELMELFTLGEGHYTEHDVTEAARALTGFALNRPAAQYAYRPIMHDTGLKTVLGRTGYLSGGDVIQQIVAQPQSARFITNKLWTFFVQENAKPEIIDALASDFRAAKLEFKPLLRTMFLSEAFYSPDVVKNQIKSPVQWLVSSLKLLERDLPNPIISSQILRSLGQELFLPPNVKGWDGGLNWITTNTIVNRYNAAATLVSGSNGNPAMQDRGGRGGFLLAGMQPALRQFQAVNIEKIVPDKYREKDQLVGYLEQRFLQGPLKPKQKAAVEEFVKSKSLLRDSFIREAVQMVMSTPEYQLT